MPFFTASVNVNQNYSKTESTNVNETYNCDRYLDPEENIDLLKIKMGKLVADKNVLVKIDAEIRTEPLNAWIRNVEEQEPKIQSLLSGQYKGVELANKVRSKLNALEELEKQHATLVENLQNQGHDLPKLAKPLKNHRRADLAPRLVGLDCNLVETCEYIAGRDYAVIGIFGACGIGKTTVLREIKRIVESSAENQKFPFTKVILMDVSHATKKSQIEKIQNEIAENLKLSGEGGQNFNELDMNKRAAKLSEALAGEIFLIMVDDLWTAIDFSIIGIPRPGSTSQSKVVYTTRLKAVCESMHPHKTVKMKYLDKLHSWKLFKAAHNSKVTVENKEIARKIVKKCAGSPLALIILGHGTISADMHYIYRCMSNSPTEIREMKEEVLDVLKPSFDELVDDTWKHCFLFFVLFQDSKNINRNRLVEYWIGEGLVQHEGGRIAELRHKANNIVEQLLGCCLLEKACHSTYVKMHSVVRSMAVWLVKRGRHAGCKYEKDGRGKKFEFEFYAGENFDEAIEKMKGAKRVSLVNAATDLKGLLNRIPDCPNLVTLLMGLCERHLILQCQEPAVSIPKNFFDEKRLPEIRVLDMSHWPISNLPNTLRHLKNLRYINLSCTSIEKLPDELGKLDTLMQLDLTGTKNLRSIRPKAISTLSNLKSLKLHDSNYKRVDCYRQLSLNDLEELESLQELQIPLQKMETFKSLSGNTRLSKLTTYLQLAIDSLDITEDEFKISLEKFVNLEILSLKSCRVIGEELKVHLDNFLKPKALVLRDQSAILKLTIASLVETNLPHVQLRKLQISSCSKLISITRLCQLQNLQTLEVEDCEEIVELLSPSGDNYAIAFRHQDHTRCLGKLKSLNLDSLPKLERISHCNLPSKYLEDMSIKRCLQLKKLHVDPPSEGRKIKMSCDEAWWQAIEWEDGAIGPSFFECFLE